MASRASPCTPRALVRLRALCSNVGRAPVLDRWQMQQVAAGMPATPSACAGETSAEKLRKVDNRRGHQVPKDLQSTRGSAVEYLETGARRPTHAEKVATLLLGQKQAILSTLSRDPRCEGHPFGSLVNVAIGPDGELMTFISRLAEHRMNLERDARCSLLIVEGQGSAGERTDPLSYARATFVGRLELAEKTQGRRAKFLGRHPRAYYVDFDDFGCFVLKLEAVRYIGGFGEMSWVEPLDFERAEPDGVAVASMPAVAHMNADHKDATCAILRAMVGGLETANNATILSIDRYGFEALAELPEGARRARVAFEQPLSSPDNIKEAIVQLLRKARGSGTAAA